MVWGRRHFPLLQKSDSFVAAFEALGDHAVFDPTLLPDLEEFVCQLYGIKDCTDCNEARYKKFCSKKKAPELQQLPQTHNALLCTQNARLSCHRPYHRVHTYDGWIGILSKESSKFNGWFKSRFLTSYQSCLLQLQKIKVLHKSMRLQVTRDELYKLV